MFLLLAFLSVFAATIPILGFVAIVWWLDHNDREPLWLVAMVFLWGALGATGMSLFGNGWLSDGIAAALGADLAERVAPPLVAPIVEEPAKALVLLPLLLTRHFENAADGFVYGAIAGLGFAMTENFLYFVSFAGSGSVAAWSMGVLMRTFGSAMVHAVCSSVVGASVGAVRFRAGGARLAALAGGFLVACSLHSVWNGLPALAVSAALPEGEEAPAAIGMLGFVALGSVGALAFLVFQLALWQERAIIERELTHEATAGLFPATWAARLGSLFGRGRGGWLPNGVPHGRFVRAACSLALRRHAAAVAPPRLRATYEDDAERLRREVRALLALARA